MGVCVWVVTLQSGFPDNFKITLTNINGARITGYRGVPSIVTKLSEFPGLYLVLGMKD